MNSRDTKMILAGDVGGTKTLLEIGTLQAGRWVSVLAARYPAAGHPDLDSALRSFLGDWAARRGPGEVITAACLGVAGPAIGNCARMTNLPWKVDGAAIEVKFGIPRVSVVNDFAAAASGVELLEDSELAVLQTGEPVIGAPRLVIGAGTGLGVAGMIWAGDRYHVVPGEGGHVGFSPTTPEQADLWRDLHARVGRVGAEHVVSGPGLVRIHEYLERAAGRTLVPGSTSPGAIVDGAIGLHDAPKMHALDLFIECYGEIAGSLALAIMARGGVYVAGGIAPRVISRLRAGGFLSAFNSKGVHSDLARKIPVSVVMNDRLGVLGCALIAARMRS